MFRCSPALVLWEHYKWMFSVFWSINMKLIRYIFVSNICIKIISLSKWENDALNSNWDNHQFYQMIHFCFWSSSWIADPTVEIVNNCRIWNCSWNWIAIILLTIRNELKQRISIDWFQEWLFDELLRKKIVANIPKLKVYFCK